MQACLQKEGVTIGRMGQAATTPWPGVRRCLRVAAASPSFAKCPAGELRKLRTQFQPEKRRHDLSRCLDSRRRHLV